MFVRVGLHLSLSQCLFCAILAFLGSYHITVQLKPQALQYTTNRIDYDQDVSNLRPSNEELQFEYHFIGA